MSTEFAMPKLGLTMEEGTIVEWLVPDGAAVADGDPVLVIATDKVETEVNVVGSGRLHQVAAVGDTRACGELVGLLLAEGEPAPNEGPPITPPADRGPAASVPVADATSPSGDAGYPTATRGGRTLASPNARRVAAELGIDLATVRGTGPGGRIVSDDVTSGASGAARPASATAEHDAVGSTRWPEAGGPTGDLVPATFAGRALAELLGIDIRTVPADERDRRVTREDVARHVRGLLARSLASPSVADGAAAPPPSQTPSQVTPMRGMRATIARRMHQSLQQMAQLTLTMDADMAAVVADRQGVSGGRPPGITDYVVAAVAAALRDHPHVNAQVTAEGVAHLPDVHVGLAVAVPGGLLVPVIRHADRLSIDELAAETARLADAARAGRLGLDELEGATFSVTALGMYGVDAFTPVINPPNVAILGVGRLRDDVVIGPDGPATATRATLSLTWDHRAFDGVPAAEFARDVVRRLAIPQRYDY